MSSENKNENSHENDNKNDCCDYFIEDGSFMEKIDVKNYVGKNVEQIDYDNFQYYDNICFNFFSDYNVDDLNNKIVFRNIISAVLKKYTNIKNICFKINSKGADNFFSDKVYDFLNNSDKNKQHVKSIGFINPNNTDFDVHHFMNFFQTFNYIKNFSLDIKNEKESYIEILFLLLSSKNIESLKFVWYNPSKSSNEFQKNFNKFISLLDPNRNNEGPNYSPYRIYNLKKLDLTFSNNLKNTNISLLSDAIKKNNIINEFSFTFRQSIENTNYINLFYKLILENKDKNICINFNNESINSNKINNKIKTIIEKLYLDKDLEHQLFQLFLTDYKLINGLYDYLNNIKIDTSTIVDNKYNVINKIILIYPVFLNIFNERINIFIHDIYFSLKNNNNTDDNIKKIILNKLREQDYINKIPKLKENIEKIYDQTIDNYNNLKKIEKEQEEKKDDFNSLDGGGDSFYKKKYLKYKNKYLNKKFK